MPKQKSVPSYRLHRARNCAVVTIHGRNYYLGAFNTPESREAYARLIAEYFGTGKQNALPTLTANRTITVTELVASYWDWAKGYYVKNGHPSGHLPKVRQALRVLRDLYGSTSAASFGPLAMRAIQRHCVAAGMSRVYINDTCGDIRRVFKWAASHELLSITVYQAVATVPGLKRGRSEARETAPVKPVGDADIEATLPHLPPVVADMVRFQRLVGCRPTEVCLIRPCDVDTTAEVWVYIPSEHKMEHHGRARRIFIGPRAQDVLRPYLLRAADAYCFSPVDSERKRHAEMRSQRKSKVQPSQLDRSKARPKRQPRGRYTKDSYNRAVSRAVDKANAERVRLMTETLGRIPTSDEREAVTMEKWSPNQLRHSVATAIRRSYGIEAAQTVLGHSRADVTQVYAERDWQKAAEVMRAIG